MWRAPDFVTNYRDMKIVQPLQILGTPACTDREIPSPSGEGNGRIYADGSVLCLTTGKWYAPEVDDTELFAMRREFDRVQGITISDRMGISTLLPHRF